MTTIPHHIVTLAAVLGAVLYLAGRLVVGIRHVTAWGRDVLGTLHGIETIAEMVDDLDSRVTRLEKGPT